MRLAIIVGGKNNITILSALAEVLNDSGCSIEESRSAVLAGHFAGFLLVDGNWNHVAKLENNLDSLAKRLDLRITTNHIEETVTTPNELPYVIDIMGADTTTMIKQLTAFLTARQISILEMNSSRYAAAYTDTAVFGAHLIIGIPCDARPISLRDEFLDFCEQNGFDAILEPIKRP